VFNFQLQSGGQDFGRLKNKTPPGPREPTCQSETYQPNLLVRHPQQNLGPPIGPRASVPRKSPSPPGQLGPSPKTRVNASGASNHPRGKSHRADTIPHGKVAFPSLGPHEHPNRRIWPSRIARPNRALALPSFPNLVEGSSLSTYPGDCSVSAPGLLLSFFFLPFFWGVGHEPSKAGPWNPANWPHGRKTLQRQPQIACLPTEEARSRKRYREYQAGSGPTAKTARCACPSVSRSRDVPWSPTSPGVPEVGDMVSRRGRPARHHGGVRPYPGRISASKPDRTSCQRRLLTLPPATPRTPWCAPRKRRSRGRFGG